MTPRMHVTMHCICARRGAHSIARGASHRTIARPSDDHRIIVRASDTFAHACGWRPVPEADALRRAMPRLAAAQFQLHTDGKSMLDASSDAGRPTPRRRRQSTVKRCVLWPLLAQAAESFLRVWPARTLQWLQAPALPHAFCVQVRPCFPATLVGRIGQTAAPAVPWHRSGRLPG